MRKPVEAGRLGRAACVLGTLFLLTIPRAAAGLDVCGLIPASTIESVQGAQVVDHKSTERVAGGLTIAQCYYVLPTNVQSVSLEVMLPGPGAASPAHPREYWRQRFSGRRESSEASAVRSGPVEIRGVGSEAFWEGAGPTGALYALEGDHFVRISIGGTAEQRVRVQKSKTLARAALRSLTKINREASEERERESR